MEWIEKAPGIFCVRDVLPPKQFFALADEFTPEYNHWTFKKAERQGVDPNFGHLADSRDGLSLGGNLRIIELGTRIQLLCRKTLGRNAKLIRVNTNIQFFAQESAFHVDSSPEMNWWTFVLFANESWNTEWGGELILQVGASDYLGIPFIPNTGVLFDGSIAHKGAAPNRFALSHRQSVAFSYELTTSCKRP